MYANQETLAQDIKRAVLAELQQGRNTSVPPPGSYVGGPDRGAQEGVGGYNPPVTNETYQAIKDSVKNEIMAEIRMQQADQLAQSYGVGRSLSDQRIQQLIDARYRTIDNMKADLKKELQALQKMEPQPGRDPHITQIAGTLADEARRQGIPLEQVMRGLDQRAPGSGLLARLGDIVNTGQRRGFLYGIGTGVICYLLWPFAKSNMRPVAVRSLEEGMSMVDRAKNYISGSFQKPPAGSANMAPPQPPQPPPEGMQPPDGDNMG